jgi:hypothetical protein
MTVPPFPAVQGSYGLPAALRAEAGHEAPSGTAAGGGRSSGGARPSSHDLRGPAILPQAAAAPPDRCAPTVAGKAQGNFAGNCAVCCVRAGRMAQLTIHGRYFPKENRCRSPLYGRPAGRRLMDVKMLIVCGQSRGKFLRFPPGDQGPGQQQRHPDQRHPPGRRAAPAAGRPAPGRPAGPAAGGGPDSGPRPPHGRARHGADDRAQSRGHGPPEVPPPSTLESAGQTPWARTAARVSPAQTDEV